MSAKSLLEFYLLNAIDTTTISRHCRKQLLLLFIAVFNYPRAASKQTISPPQYHQQQQRPHHHQKLLTWLLMSHPDSGFVIPSPSYWLLSLFFVLFLCPSIGWSSRHKPSEISILRSVSLFPRLSFYLGINSQTV